MLFQSSIWHSIKIKYFLMTLLCVCVSMFYHLTNNIRANVWLGEKSLKILKLFGKKRNVYVFGKIEIHFWTLHSSIQPVKEIVFETIKWCNLQKKKKHFEKNVCVEKWNEENK